MHRAASLASVCRVAAGGGGIYIALAPDVKWTLKKKRRVDHLQSITLNISFSALYVCIFCVCTRSPSKKMIADGKMITST